MIVNRIFLSVAALRGRLNLLLQCLYFRAGGGVYPQCGRRFYGFCQFVLPLRCPGIVLRTKSGFNGLGQLVLQIIADFLAAAV